MDTTLNYQASNTGIAFHQDDSLFRGMRGPVGSGKSVSCCFEVLKHAWRQAPFRGVRRTKVAIIRSTYPELKATTIATWMDWMGDFTEMTYGHPISGMFRPPSLDDARIECQLIFLALDRPTDIRKLKSLEVSMIWFNEASEIHEEHVHMAPARLRYPPDTMGGMTDGRIIADTNSCDISNWYYKLDQNDNDFSYVDHNNVRQEVKYTFFTQPAALLKTSEGYIPNPDAENIDNLPDGYGYYFRQLPGKPTEWVDVFVGNKYGTSNPGNRVYGDYSELNHTDKIIDEGMGAIMWSHDQNFTPLSSCISQVDADGNVYCVDEIVLKSAIASQTALEFVERYKDFKKCIVKIYGDVSGNIGAKHGKKSDYIVMEQILKEAGFRVQMKVPRSNPRIKDGQNSTRGKICDSLGKRSLFVNPEKCKYLNTCLSTLQYKKGSTFQEEETEFQHIGTALRYMIQKEYPIKKSYKAPSKYWK